MREARLWKSPVRFAPNVQKHELKLRRVASTGGISEAGEGAIILYIRWDVSVLRLLHVTYTQMGQKMRNKWRIRGSLVYVVAVLFCEYLSGASMETLVELHTGHPHAVQRAEVRRLDYIFFFVSQILSEIQKDPVRARREIHNLSFTPFIFAQPRNCARSLRSVSSKDYRIPGSFGHFHFTTSPRHQRRCEVVDDRRVSL